MSERHVSVGVPMEPRPLTADERHALRLFLGQELVRLRNLVDAAETALSGPDPEAAQVFLGMLTARTAAILFPS